MDAAYEPAAWYIARAALRLCGRITCGPLHRIARPVSRVAWRIYCRFD